MSKQYICDDCKKEFNKKLIDIDNNIDDITIKELGEIMIFLPKTKHNTNIGIKSGWNKFYVHNGEKLYYDNYEIDDLSLIICYRGYESVHIDQYFTIGKNVPAVMQIKKDIDYVLLKYIYYYLLYNTKIIVTKSGLMNNEQLCKVKIPIPNLEIQKQIIRYYSNSKKEIERIIDEFKSKINSYMDLVIT